jgi:hypothetical protein
VEPEGVRLPTRTVEHDTGGGEDRACAERDQFLRVAPARERAQVGDRDPEGDRSGQHEKRRAVAPERQERTSDHGGFEHERGGLVVLEREVEGADEVEQDAEGTHREEDGEGSRHARGDRTLRPRKQLGECERHGCREQRGAERRPVAAVVARDPDEAGRSEERDESADVDERARARPDRADGVGREQTLDAHVWRVTSAPDGTGFLTGG